MTENINQNLGGAFCELLSLEKGKRYTVALMNEFGIGVSVLKFVLEDSKAAPYAQYSESVALKFKIKGKRNSSGLRFYGSKSFAIWEGWVDVNSEAFTVPIFENGLSCQRSRYSSFDGRYLTDAIESVRTKPLFSKIN